MVAVGGRDVILVDDGIATGVTVAAAARVLHARGAGRVVVAVPVSPPGTGEALASHFDSFVSLASPAGFQSVGKWYEDFSQTSDREVLELLRASRRELPGAAIALPGARRTDRGPRCSIPTRDGVWLHGSILLPESARGLVIFVHGSGSSRRSPRNRAVAGTWQTRFRDTAVRSSDRSRGGGPAQRLRHRGCSPGACGRDELGAEAPSSPISRWGTSAPRRAPQPRCARRRSPERPSARWYRAEDGRTSPGRPAGRERADAVDRRRQRLEGARAQRRAAGLLGGPHELAVVPGADHLFEEPGTLEQVAGWRPNGSPSISPAPLDGRLRRCRARTRRCPEHAVLDSVRSRRTPR